MATIGISMVKDEADIVAGTLRHMASEVDEMIVADNGSTDGTREILDDLSRELPLTVVDDPDPAYYQSRKMSALASRAAERGAIWVIPFDADEIWWHPVGPIREVLAGMSILHPTVNVAFAELRNHMCTALDMGDPDPFRSMVWRQRDAAPLGKVAFRWESGAVIEQGNHGVYIPSGRTDLTVLNIGHFPYRSAEQFVRKAVNGAAAYAKTDLPQDWGAHWRDYGRLHDSLGPSALEDVFRSYFWHLSPIDAGLVRDPVPYQRWAQS